MTSENHLYTDLIVGSLRNVPLAVVSDAEQLPFPVNTFGIAICVGSVINYCSAASAISEFVRVLKSGGLLVLEFETSDSFEFLFTHDLSKGVTLHPHPTRRIGRPVAVSASGRECESLNENATSWAARAFCAC
jgi:ubiquinone/menaquinone biosynthesis C-methylase UbiE